MYIFKWFIIKVLKKTGLIKFFNFHLCKTINGVQVKIPFINGMGISNFFINTEWLDSLLLSFMNNENDTFVDVGINIGQTLIKVKTHRPGINYLGFEPNASCISYCQKLIKVNNFSNCNIYNTALSSTIKLLVLEKTLIDDLRASIISQLRPEYFLYKENVMAIDYDSVFYDQNTSFIKIDVEGAELDVINGMKQSIKKYQPLIVCEVLDSHHPSVFDFTQNRATELSELILSFNYSIIQLETSIKKQKIIAYNKIDTIKVKQWSPKSKDFNDYLFYPTIRENEIISELSKFCTI